MAKTRKQHSLIGHVALAWQSVAKQDASLARFDGLGLLASNVWLRETEPSRWRWLGKRLSYSVLLAATRPLGYLPVVRLGLGSVDEPLPYLAQMGSWVTGGDWTDRQGRSYRTGLSRVKVPILSVAGSGDVLLAPPGCQLRFVAQTAGPITHWQLGRRFGDPLDPNHMQVVMNRKLKPRWDEIAVWLATEGRFGTRQRGGQG